MTELDSKDFLKSLFDVSEEDRALQDALIAQAAEMGASYALDPDEMAFRRINLSSSPIAKIMAMGPDGKMTTIPEIPYDIVGFKGVILSAQFGFMLYSSEAKRPECYTVSSTLPDGSINKTSKPLPSPVYAPKAYSEDKSAREPIPEVRRYDLQGSKNGSCADCVSRGTSTLIRSDNKTDDCGLSTRVLFAVFEILVPETVMDDSGDLRNQFNWVKVQDIERGGRRVYSGPLVLNLSVSRKTVLTRIARGKFDVEVQPTAAAVPGCQTLGKYLNSLQEDNAVYRMVRRTGSDQSYMTYATVSEIYLTQPKAEFLSDWPSQLIKAVPVFRTSTDPHVLENLADWLAAAHLAYNQAIDSFISKNTGAKLGGVDRKQLQAGSAPRPVPRSAAAPQPAAAPTPAPTPAPVSAPVPSTTTPSASTQVVGLENMAAGGGDINLELGSLEDLYS